MTVPTPPLFAPLAERELLVDLGWDSGNVPWSAVYDQLKEVMKSGEANAPEQITQMISDGFPVDYFNPATTGHWTLLYWAIYFKRVDCCKTLIEHGSDVNFLAPLGRCTPLHLACEWGHIDCAKLLIDAGADWKLMTTHGTTAFDILDKHAGAGAEFKKELEEYIKSKGKQAQPDVQSKWDAAISELKFFDCDNLMEIVIAYSNLKRAISHSDTASAAAIRRAAAAGFPLNLTNNNGWTLLHWAAHQNRPECCRALKESGVNIDARAQHGLGDSAIDLTFYLGNIDCAKALIELGASAVNYSILDKRNLAIDKQIADEFRKQIQEHLKQSGTE